jgi:hypothetical protein
MFAGSAMSRHLGPCLTKAGSFVVRGKPSIVQDVFHIRATGCDQLFWMHLLAPVKATMAELEDVLRRTWLECCGHLSQFHIDHPLFQEDDPDDFDLDPDMGQNESLKAKLGEVLEAGQEFGYEYDFGSTTELNLKVIGRHALQVPRKGVSIAARNSPPTLKCAQCGARATRIATERMDEANPFCCDRCMKNSEDDEAMFLPITNSPRCGVCAYSGEMDEDQDAYPMMATR